MEHLFQILDATAHNENWTFGEVNVYKCTKKKSQEFTPSKLSWVD